MGFSFPISYFPVLAADASKYVRIKDVVEFKVTTYAGRVVCPGD